MEPVKFTFDKAFDAGAGIKHDQDLADIRAKAEADVAAAHARGLEEGRTQALQDIESATLAAIEQLSMSVGPLFNTQNEFKTRLQMESVQLSTIISNKLAEACMESLPAADVENLIRECLELTKEESRLVVRVHRDLAEMIGERMADMKSAAGFDGEIVIAADQTMALHDARIEWPDGGMERNLNEIRTEIEQAIERYVQSKLGTINTTSSDIETLDVEEVGDDINV